MIRRRVFDDSEEPMKYVFLAYADEKQWDVT